MIKSRSNFGAGMMGRRSKRGAFCQGSLMKFFEIMKLFYFLIALVVTQMYPSAKISCKFYLKKADLKKKKTDP